jgi:DNA integrity scanning protein DisA with diadenylate cyclase activity
LYPTRGNLWQSKTYDLGLTFVKACSDLLASHHGSVIVLGRHGNMEVFQSLKGDEITTRGYRVLTSVECTTIMIAELVVTSGLGSSLD